MTQAPCVDPADSAFWRERLPGFTIDADADPAALPYDGDTAATAHERLRLSGYVHLPSACPAGLAAELGQGLAALAGMGLPAVCIFLYDQSWWLLRSIAPNIEAVLGRPYLQMSNFWGWRVSNDAASLGFAPHRDYYEPMIGTRGDPLSVNLWIALSDAQPPGSCLYFLPAERDPNYPFNLRDISVETLPDVVAVPAAPGDVVCVGANVLHWGSRSSGAAAAPRLSIAMQVQAAELPPLSPRLWEPGQIPSFAERRALVTEQLQQFRHHAGNGPEIERFAQLLAA